MPEEPPTSNQAPPPRSRYERVKEILNQAAGESSANYQGYEKFWNLPLDEFLQVTIYGVRMIAPAGSPGVAQAVSGGSCCHATPAATPAAPEDEGRGAASGLIRGLRGFPPFDGSQFPRLPWGGQPVPVADIQFIEHWIDAGCPPIDDAPEKLHVQVTMNRKLARAQGHEAHPLHSGSTNDFREDIRTNKARKNIHYLTPDELQRFRNAVTRLKSLNAYPRDHRSWDSWARIHADLCQHGWEEFLTWHRAYLYFFEQQLQDFDSSVTLPYWDWAMYKDNVSASLEDMAAKDPSLKTDNGIVPEAYRCWIDAAALDRLKNGGIVPDGDIDKLSAVLDQKFDSGPRFFTAAKIPYQENPSATNAIQDELARVNPLWHRFRWPGGDKDLIFEVYPAPEDVENILQIPNFFDFASGPSSHHFFGAVENIHNLIHNFSGGQNPYYDKKTPSGNRTEPQFGDMQNPGWTAFDPLFWGHHSNVDRLWSEWQKLHPGQEPDNETAILAPWSMNVAQTLNIHNLGYEYVQQSFAYPTDVTIPVTRFKSEAAPVHPQVVKSFHRAEVRLHKVRYVTRTGYHIRVFINEPDANVQTPARGNPHYAGIVNMFTGSCIGGEGHCDPPAKTRRSFDWRPRAHKTPGNFRIDATETVRKLAAAGDTEFHVSLVVLNTDGTPATDALHFEAASLTFQD